MKLKLILKCSLAVLSLLIWTVPSYATDNKTIGVVVMHGKWDSPNGHIAGFANSLEKEGFVVVRPEMPWSGRRSYDAGVDGMVKDIDAAIVKLREQGANKIFVAGHSFGTAGALRYITQTKVNGMIALAPGHAPEGRGFAAKTADSIKKAKEMSQSGQADEKGWFADINTGSRSKSLQMTARIYLDYFDPEGPMNFRNNAATIRTDVPVLWIAGINEEESLKNVSKAALASMPKTTPPMVVEVPGGHMDTPDQASAIAITWIKELADK